MDFIKEFFTIEVVAPLTAVLVAKFTPNEWLFKGAKGVGVALTLGLSKFKVTSKIWNKTLEPWLIDNVKAITDGFFAGLKSDN